MELDGPLGIGKKTCGCRRCGKRFSTLHNFDKHQRTTFGTDTPIICLDPREVGLVQNKRGIWKAPPRPDEPLFSEEEDE